MLRLFATVLSAVLFADVSAHGYVSSPRPRAQTINGHRFAYEPQSDGQKNGECWDAARGLHGGLQATYTEGQTITTAVRITAFHKGWHEIRLCDNINGKNNCLSQTRATALTNPRNGNVNSKQSVLQGLGTKNYKWRLPANFTCNRCTMQWWWNTDNGGSETFKSCHDVRIVSSGPPTTPPTSPPTWPPTPSAPTTPYTMANRSGLRQFCSNFSPTDFNNGTDLLQVLAPNDQAPEYIENQGWVIEDVNLNTCKQKCLDLGSCNHISQWSSGREICRMYTAETCVPASGNDTWRSFSKELPAPSPPTAPPTNPPTRPPTSPPAPTVPCFQNWEICSSDPNNCCSGKCSGNQCQP